MMKISKKHFKILIITNLLGALFYFSQSPRYETLLSIYPSYGGDGNADLLSLASNFGIGSTINDNDPVIYTPDIVESYILKEKLLRSIYPSLNNISLLEKWKSEKFLSQYRAFDEKLLISQFGSELNENIVVHIDRTSGLITIKTYFEDPDLSVEVNEIVFNYVTDFINEANKAQSINKLNYMESRYKVLKEELNDAETNLSDFLNENTLITSPLLQMEYSRLLREIEIKNQSFSLLSLEMETEKLNSNKKELNFIVSDKYNNPIAVKLSIFEIFFISNFSVIFLLVTLRYRRKIIPFFSNH